MAVHRSRGKHPLIHGERQLGNVVGGRGLRLLGRAIARVPPGAVLNRMDKVEGKQWDHHTGLFLRKRGQQPRSRSMTTQQALAALDDVMVQQALTVIQEVL
jgi:hypothetical protein